MENPLCFFYKTSALVEGALWWRQHAGEIYYCACLLGKCINCPGPQVMTGLYLNPTRASNAPTRTNNRVAAAVGAILALGVIWFLLVAANKFSESTARHFCSRVNDTNATVCV